MIAAGAALPWQYGIGCDVLAVGAGLLLLVGIRNAWDMTIFDPAAARLIVVVADYLNP